MNQTKHVGLVLAVGVIFLILGLAGHALPTKDLESPKRVFFDNAGGAVLFPHEQHEEFDCAQCHHELLTEEVETSCTLCHHEDSFEIYEWEDEDIGDLHAEFTTEDHTDCIDCHSHEDFTSPTPPPAASSCAECHDDYVDYDPILTGHNCSACHATADDDEQLVMACAACHQSGEGEAQSCDACHPDDEFEPDDLDHAELTDIDGHTCAACHVAGRSADAYHNRCTRCHQEQEKFSFFSRSKEDAETVCKTCHMK